MTFTNVRGVVSLIWRDSDKLKQATNMKISICKSAARKSASNRAGESVERCASNRCRHRTWVVPPFTSRICERYGIGRKRKIELFMKGAKQRVSISERHRELPSPVLVARLGKIMSFHVMLPSGTSEPVPLLRSRKTVALRRLNQPTARISITGRSAAVLRQYLRRAAAKPYF
jgi:hypothetical protein